MTTLETVLMFYIVILQAGLYFLLHLFFRFNKRQGVIIEELFKLVRRSNDHT